MYTERATMHSYALATLGFKNNPGGQYWDLKCRKVGHKAVLGKKSANLQSNEHNLTI